MVKTLERDRYTLCEKHVIVPFCCSYQVYRYLAGCFGLISCRHYLKKSPVDEPVYQFLDKKRSEGKPYFVYMTAAQNKFLRIYYARVKECLEAFDAQQDTSQR